MTTLSWMVTSATRQIWIKRITINIIITITVLYSYISIIVVIMMWDGGSHCWLSASGIQEESSISANRQYDLARGGPACVCSFMMYHYQHVVESVRVAMTTDEDAKLSAPRLCLQYVLRLRARENLCELFSLAANQGHYALRRPVRSSHQNAQHCGRDTGSCWSLLQRPGIAGVFLQNSGSVSDRHVDIISKENRCLGGPGRGISWRSTP